MPSFYAYRYGNNRRQPPLWMFDRTCFTSTVMPSDTHENICGRWRLNGILCQLSNNGEQKKSQVRYVDSELFSAIMQNDLYKAELLLDIKINWPQDKKFCIINII